MVIEGERNVNLLNQTAHYSPLQEENPLQFTRINGAAIHYELIGIPGDKPVIAFANSLGTDFRIWREVVARLANDFTMLVYDKRGHGLSDITEAPHSIEAHASDLAVLLDLLSIRRAFICGLSIGGLIAQSLYEQRPDLVQALVLCDTAHKIGSPAMWDGRIAEIEAKGLAGIADAVMERWFTPTFRRLESAAVAGYVNMLIRQPVEGYTAACAAIRDADLTEAARRIAVPTLCLVGDQDGATPPDLVRLMADLIAGARFETIADAGHIPCVEQAETLATILRRFIASVCVGENIP
jgi:3-oxoadipate enol-lactonase